MIVAATAGRKSHAAAATAACRAAARRVTVRDSVRTLAAVVVALAVSAPAAAAPPYPLLAERDGIRVYGPAPGQAWGRCPRAQPTRVHELPTAERAVLLAVPRLYSRERGPVRTDIRDATARAVRIGASVSTRAGPARATCGRRISALSLAVHVGFPHVDWSASMSSATFFVARVREGWVLWHQAH
jgi:hypothetical protein